MDIRKKLEYFEKHLDSIATHDDEDSQVLDAALTRCEQLIAQKREAMRARAAARIAEQVGSP